MDKPFATGAKIREPKLSDFDLGSLTPQTGIPSTFMPEYAITIENQAQQPACGAHAGAEVDNILKGNERNAVVRVSPEYGWKIIKQIDGLPISDGTDIGSLMKSLAQGYCDYTLMPNTADTQTLDQYADPSTITNDMQLNAVNNALSNVYAFTNNPTMDQIKAAIYTHKAVILCMRIGAEWWTPSWREADILPLNPNKYPIVDGHFITAYAYDATYIYFYNHWTDQWGRMGIGYFGANYVSRVVCMGTTVDLTKAFSFTRSLGIGTSGTDVGILQMILKKEGVFPATQKITSYYGNVTAQAVSALQSKYAAQVLTPAGLTAPTGYAASHTLSFLNAKYQFAYGKTNIQN